MSLFNLKSRETKKLSQIWFCMYSLWKNCRSISSIQCAQINEIPSLEMAFNGSCSHLFCFLRMKSESAECAHVEGTHDKNIQMHIASNWMRKYHTHTGRQAGMHACHTIRNTKREDTLTHSVVARGVVDISHTHAHCQKCYAMLCYVLCCAHM